MGCLITDRVVYEEGENLPPSIVSPPGATTAGVAIDQIITINRAELTGAGDAGVGNELRIPVIIRDPNVQQELEWKILLDYRTSSPVVTQLDDGVIQPRPGGLLERPLDLSISKLLLAPGPEFVGRCRKLELLVSTGFVGARQPREPGDLASAVWWIAITDEQNTPVDMKSCP